MDRVDTMMCSESRFKSLEREYGKPLMFAFLKSKYPRKIKMYGMDETHNLSYIFNNYMTNSEKICLRESLIRYKPKYDRREADKGRSKRKSGRITLQDMKNSLVRTPYIEYPYMSNEDKQADRAMRRTIYG